MATRCSSSPSPRAIPRSRSARTGRPRCSTARDALRRGSSTPTQRIDLLRKQALECHVADATARIEAGNGRSSSCARRDGPRRESTRCWGSTSRTARSATTAAGRVRRRGARGARRHRPEPAAALATGRRGSHHLRASEMPGGDPMAGTGPGDGPRRRWDHEVVARGGDAPGSEPVPARRARGGPGTGAGGAPDRRRARHRGLRRADLPDARRTRVARLRPRRGARHPRGRRAVHAERDLTGHLMCVLASEITMKLDLGRWDEAMAEARDLLYVRNTGRASRIEPLMAIGLLAARRGESDQAWTYLDRARDYISKSQTLGYQSFVATAAVKTHLLAGDLEADGSRCSLGTTRRFGCGTRGCSPSWAILVWRAGLIDALHRGPPPARGPVDDPPAPGGRSLLVVGSARRTGGCLGPGRQPTTRSTCGRRGRCSTGSARRRSSNAPTPKLRSIGAKVPRGARRSTRANVRRSHRPRGRGAGPARGPAETPTSPTAAPVGEDRRPPRVGDPGEAGCRHGPRPCGAPGTSRRSADRRGERRPRGCRRQRMK